MMIFKTYSYSKSSLRRDDDEHLLILSFRAPVTLSQGLNFVSDMKMGHYMVSLKASYPVFCHSQTRADPLSSPPAENVRASACLRGVCTRDDRSDLLNRFLLPHLPQPATNHVPRPGMSYERRLAAKCTV